MPFCYQCGSQLPENAVFCGKCGAQQQSAAQPAAQAQPANPALARLTNAGPAPAYQYAGAPAVKKRGSIWKWLIPLLLIAAAAAIVLAYFLSDGSGNDEEAARLAKVGKSDEELISMRIAEFEKALTSGDIDGMLECMDAEMRAATEASIEAMEEEMQGSTGFGMSTKTIFSLAGLLGDFCDISIEDIAIDGETAVISLTMNMDLMGETSSEQMNMPMVKIDGDWYLGGTDAFNLFY